MNSYDIVIAGNGILGCATALELIRNDNSLRIAVIGPKQRIGGATIAAGAMLNCITEVNHRTLSTAVGKAKLEISIRALEAWPAWLDALNSELSPTRRLAIRNGTYVILNNRAGRLDSLNYNAVIDAAIQYHQKFERVPFGNVPHLKPGVDARPLDSIYLADEGAIDARQVLNAVESVANRSGVVFLDDTVVGWKRKNNQVSCAITASGEEVQADRFLVAAGVASRSLLADLAESSAMPLQPILASKGVAVTSRGTGSGGEHVVRTPNRAGGCGLHMVPGSDGTVYLGATGDLMMQADEFQTIGAVRFLINAMDQFDKRLFHSKITQWHVGNRPVSLDGFPLIGRVWQDNVWVLSGTHRDGFHCSPLLARHTADIMLGGIGILGDHCFAPLRRPLSAMSREDAIDELSLHLVSQFYENSGKSPAYSEVSETLEKQYRTRTRETYDKLEIDFGLAPDILGLLNWAVDREAKIGYFRQYFQQVSRASQEKDVYNPFPAC
ncbi:NAD(P)/FAD-dependent oxidoreductase [Streptomyces spongiae]|uniref:FAD-binding oxidoreductase n=1 Tax=Streptomyces spongiae TaxID=565072 RepID=A0A5N8XX05_9ACTN|nr:FAD-dependent oxidoreductase [Streptomyces spongiae]MPY63914.1 FAD-binding oxidoreductase [Streptomyces spongiae]